MYSYGLVLTIIVIRLSNQLPVWEDWTDANFELCNAIRGLQIHNLG